MRFFKKKVTQEEFRKADKRLKRSVYKLKKHNRSIERNIKAMNKVMKELSPLLTRFTELERRFTEFTQQFNNDSLSRVKMETIEQTQSKSSKKAPAHISMDVKNDHLTPLEQKGLVFIGRLQDESRSSTIPVGHLTSNLYPDRVTRKMKTTVSNILRKLINLDLISRERMGNYWYIGLTAKGYSVIKKLFQQNPLKNLGSCQVLFAI